MCKRRKGQTPLAVAVAVLAARRGVQITELARRAGMRSTRFIARLHRPIPTLQTLEIVSGVFGIALQDLLDLVWSEWRLTPVGELAEPEYKEYRRTTTTIKVRDRIAK